MSNTNIRYKHNELIGKTFGRWTINSFSDNKDSCKCNCTCTCGLIKDVWFTHLIKGTTKGCSKCAVAAATGEKNIHWKGVGEISADWWCTHVTRGGVNSAKTHNRRHIPVIVTMRYAWDLFLIQNRKCALSGIELCFPKGRSNNGTASIDRIDSSHGYIEDNIQWVHKSVNLMKNRLPQKDFIEFCKLVANNNK